MIRVLQNRALEGLMRPLFEGVWNSILAKAIGGIDVRMQRNPFFWGRKNGKLEF
jgi:hypothetical protein